MSSEDGRPEGQDPANSPTKPKRTLTPEHKAALLAGRKKRKPEVLVPTDDYTTLLRAVVDLQQQVADLTAQRDAATTAPRAVGNEADDVATIMKLPPEQRADAFLAYLKDLTPAQRAAREAAIKQAYSALPPAPMGDEALRPGTYVVTGADNQGQPIKTKVRYTREWIDANYPIVDVFPMVDSRGPVIFGGVPYHLKVGQVNRVPSIIAELYSNYVTTINRESERWGPLMPEEKHRLEYLIAKGEKRVWTRVHQVGVGVMPPETFPNSDASAPGTEA